MSSQRRNKTLGDDYQSKHPKHSTANLSNSGDGGNQCKDTCESIHPTYQMTLHGSMWCQHTSRTMPYFGMKQESASLTSEDPWTLRKHSPQNWKSDSPINKKSPKTTTEYWPSNTKVASRPSSQNWMNTIPELVSMVKPIKR